MIRAVTVAALLATLALASSVARAQQPYGPMFGAYGYGGYGGYSPYGGYGAGGYGAGPYGGYGPYAGYSGLNGGYAGLNSGYAGLNAGYGYGPFNYAQQLFQQQASQTQQIFQQQQNAILDQIGETQGRLERLDAAKQQMFQKYLDLSDSDKAAVRTRLMNDYLNLDARGREGWRRDAVVQILIGKDLPRLDGLAQFRDMSEPDKALFRQSMLQKYRSLAPAEQQAWQNDPIVGNILGKDWWLQ